MSRSKQYDRTDLLNKSVELFRRTGFNGTSTADLVSELGINRKSMYAEFGSKQKLFEATLDYYNQNHLSRVLAPLEAEDAGLESIRQAFYGYALAIEGPFRGLGCLMCNTAAERGALEAGSKPFIDAYLKRLTRAFKHVLANAQQNGEIDPLDTDEMAGFLTTTLVGVAASVRAEASPEQVWATYQVITKMVDRLSSRQIAAKKLAVSH